MVLALIRTCSHLAIIPPRRLARLRLAGLLAKLANDICTSLPLCSCPFGRLTRGLPEDKYLRVTSLRPSQSQVYA